MSYIQRSLPKFALLILGFFSAGSLLTNPEICVGGGMVTNCTETALDAALDGGGIVVIQCGGDIVFSTTKIIQADTTIEGAGLNVRFNGAETRRLFQVEPGVAFSISNVELLNGLATNNDGRDGRSGSPSGSRGGNAGGGAILNLGGEVKVAACTFINNRAVGGMGGAGYASAGCEESGNGGGGGSAQGAAIHHVQGSLTILNSTFARNIAEGGSAGNGGNGGPCGLGSDGRNGRDGGNAYGGGIYVEDGSVAITNSTFFENVCMAGPGGAGGDGSGGLGRGGDGGNGGQARGSGLYNLSGIVSIANCTLATNTVTGGSGGARGLGVESGLNGDRGNSGRSDAINAYSRFGSIDILNSILSGGTPADNNCGGSIIDLGYNLSSDQSCLNAPTSRSNIDPLISHLGDNGGLTMTLLPQEGSPAINAGRDEGAANFDQRYRYRTDPTDIGAVELGGVEMILSIQSLPETRTAAEGDTNKVTIRMTRSGPTNFPLIVNVYLHGTATPNEDFILSGLTNDSDQVTIHEGFAFKDYEMEIVDDEIAESDETIDLILLSGFYFAPTNHSLSVVILDNDTLKLSVEKTESNGNGSGFSLTFQSKVDRLYTIEGSTNLVDWESATNLLGTGSRMTWKDPDSLVGTKRFYRAHYE